MDTITKTRPRYSGPFTRTLASGSVAHLDDTGRVLFILTPDQLDDQHEGPTCSLCDGLGHGYPGGGPCPLEDRGEPEDYGFRF